MAHRQLLADHHRVILEGQSAISPAVIAQRGYWSADSWRALSAGGVRNFSGYQLRPERFPVLVIPHHGPNGAITYSVVRPDHPRTRQNGKLIKYEHPAGVDLRLDVPVSCIDGVRDASLPLWITEGAKKADALASAGLVAVNLPGVWAWKPPTVKADLHAIALRDRQVVIAFDSDVLSKPEVRRAVDGLGRWLSLRGAELSVLDWAAALRPAQ